MTPQSDSQASAANAAPAAPVVPPGYMRDARGRLVPEEHVQAIDRLRTQTVERIAQAALEIQQTLAAFKASAMADIEAFVATSAEQYGAKLGGTKGNLQLVTFDGDWKVLLQVSDRITFDERLMAAKALVDECITDWATNSRSEIRALIADAFRVDKAGAINVGRVLGLRRLDIRDERWQRAMQAVSDSLQVVGSRSYIRIYQRRPGTDDYLPIPLDLAAV